MARYFTLSEAEALLPTVERHIREALFLKTEFTRAEEELRSTTRKVMMSGGVLVDRERVAATKELRGESGKRLQQLFEQIQEIGCLVKDLDIGLLDFPTLYHGSEVYLCWRLGEDRISFWHKVEDGFPGRQPIDEEFLANHRGESPQ